MKNRVAIFAIIVVLLTLSGKDPGKLYVLDVTGHDWKSWSDGDQITWCSGFISGSWTSIQIAINRKIISPLDYPDWSKIAPYRIGSDKLANEIDRFYETTNRYDYPVSVVVFMRRWIEDVPADQFPPWERMKGDWE